MALEVGNCDSTHPDKYLAQLELDYMLEHVTGKTLNVGCGSGHETMECKKKTGDATGLDFSPEMIRAAKQKFQDITFLEGSVLKLPFPDHIFDSVTTSQNTN